MSVSARTRKFHRTDISRTEKSIGGFIIVLLVAIGLTIALKGRAYDPSKYTGSMEALEFTREAVVGIAATLKNETDLRASELAGVAAPAGGAQPKELPAFISGLSPMGPTENYVPDTLYEKINGRAPAYMEYNFQQLTSRSYTIDAIPGEFIDIYLFRMDSPLNAFGIFSAERDDSGTQLAFVADGYESEMGYFLRHGDIYVQTVASSTQPEVMQLAKSYTEALVKSLPANDSGMEGRNYLPTENQITGSLTYINDNAYGQASLSAVFEAKYDFGGQELTYFVKSCADPAEASKIWESVLGFYSSYGSEQATTTEEGTTFFSANLFGQWASLYKSGSILAGVINSPELQPANDFIQLQLPGSTAADEEEFEY